jgi:phosphate transport system permease protein
VLIISPVFQIQPHILQNGTSSIASLIALRYAEATPFAVSALMAAGLGLFALTLLVNFGAAMIVSRSRWGAVSEA